MAVLCRPQSTTTFVEGLIMLLYPAVDSAAIDGWSALVVCTLIAFGILGGIGKWVGELRLHLAGGRGGGVLI